MSPKFISVENPKQFICMFAVPCGSIHESEQHSGISHLVEHILFRTQNVMEQMIENGIIYNAYTGQDYTIYFSTCDAKYCVPTFKNLQKVVHTFDVSKASFEKERKIVIEELAISYNNPFTDIFSIIHKNTPYFSSILGTRDTLNNITFNDIKAYYNQHYSPESILSLVVCHPKWEARIKQASLTSTPVLYSPHHMDFNINRVLDKEHRLVLKTKTDYEVGNIAFLGYPSSSPKNMMCIFAAYILNLQMFDILREKKASVYTAGCFYTGMMHTGFFNLRFKTQSSNINEILQIIGKQLQWLKRISKYNFDEKLRTFVRRQDAINSEINVTNALSHMEDILYSKNADISTINYSDFKILCKTVFSKNKCSFVFKKNPSTFIKSNQLF